MVYPIIYKVSTILLVVQDFAAIHSITVHFQLTPQWKQSDLSRHLTRLAGSEQTSGFIMVDISVGLYATLQTLKSINAM